MTFEEALKLVEEKASVYWGTYRVENLVNDLQETYASKIKMTKAQFDWFTIAICLYSELEDILVHRWETPTISEDGYNDEVREIRLLDDKILALAWMHPELIEVTDE